MVARVVHDGSPWLFSRVGVEEGFILLFFLCNYVGVDFERESQRPPSFLLPVALLKSELEFV